MTELECAFRRSDSEWRVQRDNVSLWLAHGRPRIENLSHSHVRALLVPTERAGPRGLAVSEFIPRQLQQQEYLEWVARWESKAEPPSLQLKHIFSQLVAQWRKETAFKSSLRAIIMHPAYQQIIGLGASAVPLVLRELEREPGHWFWALQSMTGEDPVPPDATFDEAASAWLRWGRQRGLLR